MLTKVVSSDEMEALRQGVRESLPEIELIEDVDLRDRTVDTEGL